MRRFRSLFRILWLLALVSASVAFARELRLEIAAPHPSTLEVFWGHTVFDFTGPNSANQPFAGDGQFHEHRFKIPDGPRLTLRIDPGSIPGEVWLRRVTIHADDGALLAAIPATALEAMQQAAVSIDPGDATAVLVRIPAGSNDPSVLVNDMVLRRLLDRNTAAVRAPAFLACCALLALVVLATWVVALRWCAPPDAARRQRLLVAAGLALLVFGVRLATLSGRVSWAPYLDEFEGELGTLISPFQSGVLGWDEFAAPHNDHRIATTRIVSLGSFLLNGEWDNRVLCVANCALVALGVGWFALFALRELRGRDALVPILLLAVGSVLPNDWANIAVGFQLQFHFVVIASLLALTLLPNAPFGRAASVAGFLAALFAAASMGSGFLALVAGGAGIVVRLWLDRRAPAAAWVLLALSVAVAIFAWETRAVFHALDHLRAKNAAHFFAALEMYGGWPLPISVVSLLALWLPWLALTLRVLLRRQGSAFEVFVVTLGGWMLLQVVALAWGRAGFAPVMSSRYTGLLLWTSVVAASALVALTAAARPALRLALPLGFALVLGGFLAQDARSFFGPQFAEFAGLAREHESRLGTFMRDHDPRVFSTVPFPHRPYEITERLVSLLNEPGLRTAWPAPLQRERFRASDPAAFARVRTGPLTWVARFLLGAGPALALGGLALIGAGLFWRRPAVPA